MVPVGVKTSNDPRSPKVLRAPHIFTLKPIQYGELWTPFDLRVDTRWMLTVFTPPRTPLRSLKAPRVLSLFKVKPLQYGCQWTSFDLGVGTRWTLTVSRPPRTLLLPWRSRGCLVFWSSNPYNKGVYWLLLTSGSMHHGLWPCPEPPGLEVLEDPQGNSYFYPQILTIWVSMTPFDLRVDLSMGPWTQNL